MDTELTADLTPDRLAEFIDIADPAWIEPQLASYEEFRHKYAPEGVWSHRSPSMSPVVPLVYWSSKEPYQVTNEMPMGYWVGEPKSILGHLVVRLLEFREYWESLPDGKGLKNIRWCLRSPQRFASFAHEISTAAIYKLRTPYEVEPRFFDPRSRPGEPDIVLTKGGRTFNVQCKSMDPSTSSSMSFETFLYMSGRLVRLSQDHNIHSRLSVLIDRYHERSIARRDVDRMLIELQRDLKHGLVVPGQRRTKGWRFAFQHRPGYQHLPVDGVDLLDMWSAGHQFRQSKSVAGKSPLSDRLTTLCEVKGGRIPNFSSYVFPRLEEAAKKAPKDVPTIICLHLYPPVPVHGYRKDPVIQGTVIPWFDRFFERHRHACLVLLSSNAQQPFLVGDNKQIIGTPAWELESAYWEGERPDYYPSGSILG